jgi:hypothetical protein
MRSAEEATSRAGMAEVRGGGGNAEEVTGAQVPTMPWPHNCVPTLAASRHTGSTQELANRRSTCSHLPSAMLAFPKRDTFCQVPGTKQVTNSHSEHVRDRPPEEASVDPTDDAHITQPIAPLASRTEDSANLIHRRTQQHKHQCRRSFCKRASKRSAVRNKTLPLAGHALHHARTHTGGVS